MSCSLIELGHNTSLATPDPRGREFAIHPPPLRPDSKAAALRSRGRSPTTNHRRFSLPPLSFLSFPPLFPSIFHNRFSTLPTHSQPSRPTFLFTTNVFSSTHLLGAFRGFSESRLNLTELSTSTDSASVRNLPRRQRTA